jgi:7-cyano-7-deazaguanine synthase
LNASAALVLFSGGQDSTTALAWALSRYEIVETAGFRYGQKHLVEMERRPVIREAIVELIPSCKTRLGPDHIVELDLVGQIAAKGIASPTDRPQIAGEGFAAGKRYIPGRNLIMLSLCASVAFRRDIRTLVCGTSETEYSGYPDCRDASMKAIEAAINLSSGLIFKVECPLMWLDKAGVWALAQSIATSDRAKSVMTGATDAVRATPASSEKRAGESSAVSRHYTLGILPGFAQLCPSAAQTSCADEVIQ